MWCFDVYYLKMKEWNNLTCSHSGLLSLMSSTWTSTITGAPNFPSVAVTLSVYRSLVSLSRGSFTIKPHSPSSAWMMANCPKGSPSAFVMKNTVTSFKASLKFRQVFNRFCTYLVVWKLKKWTKKKESSEEAQRIKSHRCIKMWSFNTRELLVTNFFDPNDDLLLC